ncbi:MAG: ATP-dependent helicase, partial [Desulfobulbaceae bacterium]|nr:ATP-dependent helicase [Desulfobulbaceae bacterium]
MQTTPSPLQQYEKLSLFEQALMQFISIVYEPAHSTLIVNCLRKLELKNPRGNRPTVTNLNHYLSKFEQVGLLTKERQCSPEIVEILSKIAVSEGIFEVYAKVIQSEAPVSYYYGKWTTRCWRAMREMRIGVYTEKFNLIDDAQEFLDSQCRDLVSTPPPTVQIMTQPFDADWFRTLATSFQFYLLSNVLQYGQETLSDYPEILAFLSSKDEFSHLSVDEQLPFKRLLFNELLFQGKYTDAEELVTIHMDLFQGTGALGTILFLKGENETALASFEEDIGFLQKYSNSENVSFFGPTGLFYILARISSRKKDFPAIANQVGIALLQFRGAPENDSYNYLATVVNSQITQGMHGVEIVLPEAATQNALTVVFAGLCQYWLNSSIQPEIEAELVAFYEKARSGNYGFFTLVLGDILSTILHDSSPYLSANSRLREKSDIIPLLSILEPEEPWKRSLQALIYATSQDEETPRQSIRLVWIVAFEGSKININPREQKLAPNKKWSKGRPISLSRLYQTNQLTYLTPQDRKICAAIRRVHNVETQSATYHFNMDKALVAMISHPLLFLSESDAIPVEFVTGEPELLVEERGDFLHIRFAQPVSSSNICHYRETPTRVKIIPINDNHRRIAQITGKDGMTVPLSASEQVLTAIGNISSFMTVHSAIAADNVSNRPGDITFADSDSTTYIHLIPYGTGFRLEMFVKPFIDGGHYLKPGQGVENIMAEVKGKRFQTKRNLALEEENARDVEELCPILDLAIDMEQENDREWHLQDPDDCLQALTELQAIRDKVRIEWPEGEKLTITQKA